VVVGDNIEGRTTTKPIAIYWAIETGGKTKAGMWSLVLGTFAVLAAIVGRSSMRRGYRQFL